MKKLAIAMAMAMACFFTAANAAVAEIILEKDWYATAINSPTPATFTWNSSMAYYNGQLFYTGDDGNIYAFSNDNASAQLVCETSELGGEWGSPTAFLVTTNDFLYFTDNGTTSNIYRVNLTQNRPAPYQAFDTQCDGIIFSMTQDPENYNIWFASADFGSGDQFYLYRVEDFAGAKKKVHFTKPHGGGNGPILFLTPTSVIYGESVYNGDGYLHLISTVTETVLDEDWQSFVGGITSMVYGYDNDIFLTTGNGKRLIRLVAPLYDEKGVASTSGSPQTIVYDKSKFFYLSEMDLTTGSSNYSYFWESGSSGGGDGGSSGCFIDTVNSGGKSIFDLFRR